MQPLGDHARTGIQPQLLTWIFSTSSFRVAFKTGGDQLARSPARKVNEGKRGCAQSHLLDVLGADSVAKHHETLLLLADRTGYRFYGLSVDHRQRLTFGRPEAVLPARVQDRANRRYAVPIFAQHARFGIAAPLATAQPIQSVHLPSMSRLNPPMEHAALLSFTETHCFWTGGQTAFRGRYHADQLLFRGQKPNGAGHGRGRRRACSGADPCSKYLPRFSEGPAADLTIEQVLQMRIGIPYGRATRTLSGSCPSAHMETTSWPTCRITLSKARQVCLGNTKGATPCLLQEILLEVIDVPWVTWFATKVWGPIGATTEAKWAVDNAGMSAITPASTPRPEFARLGQALARTPGKVEGRRFWSGLCRRDDHPIGPLADGTDISITGIKCGWGTTRGWLLKACRGFMANIVISIPELELVAVRTGFFRPKGKMQGD